MKIEFIKPLIEVVFVQNDEIIATSGIFNPDEPAGVEHSDWIF